MKQKVLLLLSGGLDSTLALTLLQDAGYEVEAVNFKTIFCRCNRKGCSSEAKKITEKKNVKLHVYNTTNEFLPIVLNPPHGYGSNMNPCIDCRILMYRKAKELMGNIGASFIATGEVIGQRPMSQNVQAINIIEKASGMKDKVIRPLSDAGISGRSRKIQIELAKEKGINDYPCPAGGCLLTDPAFTKRLRDLISNNGKKINVSDVLLLKTGRHFRLGKDVKLVVGRNEEENNSIKNFVSDTDVLLEVDGYVGPLGLMKNSNGNVSDNNVNVSSRIVARYSDAPMDDNIKVDIKSQLFDRSVSVSKIDDETIKKLIV